MAQLVPYLAFDGNCRDAMNFYESCIGGNLNLMTMGDSPMGGQTPDAQKNWIMHGSLVKDNITIMASDAFGAEGVTRGNEISLCLVCNSDEEITEYFNKLSEGGKVSHPLKVEFWGGTYGDFVDKFGVRWMLNYEKNPST